jgi:hypothetical protein
LQCLCLIAGRVFIAILWSGHKLCTSFFASGGVQREGRFSPGSSCNHACLPGQDPCAHVTCTILPKKRINLRYACKEKPLEWESSCTLIKRCASVRLKYLLIYLASCQSCPCKHRSQHHSVPAQIALLDMAAPTGAGNLGGVADPRLSVDGDDIGTRHDSIIHQYV